MKLAFITTAASLLGAVLVAAATSADGHDRAASPPPPPIAVRSVRVAQVPPCASGPGCGEERADAGPSLTIACALPPSGPGPLILASRLAATESFVGIREEQLDLWRGYTDALFALLHPPGRDRRALEAPQKPPAEPPDALDQSAALAACAADQSRAAERLASAIEALRRSLAPEQLDRLRQAGPLLPPRPPFPEPGERPPFPARASFGPPGPEGPGEPGQSAPR